MKKTLYPPMKTRFAAGVSLFFLAPFVGEFLLGNLPVTMFYLMPVLALLYGGGALLIRETAVRLNLNKAGLLLLCLAYGIIEETFNTQSLFDPNYLGLRLLDYGYVPFLKMGSWWTVYVLGIHIVWSTAVPVLLIDYLFPKVKGKPVLGIAGIVVVAAGFAFAAFAPLLNRPEQAFMASGQQFMIAGIAVILLCLLAILGFRKRNGKEKITGNVPSPLSMGIISLLLGSGFMALTFVTTYIPAWLNVTGMLLLFTAGGVLFGLLSRRSGWSPKHTLYVVGGLLFTYLWFGFVQTPSIGAITPLQDTLGNILFSLVAVGVFILAHQTPFGAHLRGSVAQ